MKRTSALEQLPEIAERDRYAESLVEAICILIAKLTPDNRNALRPLHDIQASISHILPTSLEVLAQYRNFGFDFMQRRKK